MPEKYPLNLTISTVLVISLLSVFCFVVRANHSDQEKDCFSCNLDLHYICGTTMIFPVEVFLLRGVGLPDLLS